MSEIGEEEGESSESSQGNNTGNYSVTQRGGLTLALDNVTFVALTAVILLFTTGHRFMTDAVENTKRVPKQVSRYYLLRT